MSSLSIKEFKPTILFLVRFIGLYLAGNLLYGWYITSYEPRPDPVTHAVSSYTVDILGICGYAASIYDYEALPTTAITYEGDVVIAVYEGCNGINTAIIFVAFILAFGPVSYAWFWFIPAGLLIIHLMNLLRITLLFFVAKDMPHIMYFTHKYLFTAFLYGVVFLLWMWWVKQFSSTNKRAQ